MSIKLRYNLLWWIVALKFKVSTESRKKLLIINFYKGILIFQIFILKLSEIQEFNVIFTDFSLYNMEVQFILNWTVVFEIDIFLQRDCYWLPWMDPMWKGIFKICIFKKRHLKKKLNELNEHLTFIKWTQHGISDQSLGATFTLKLRCYLKKLKYV